MSITVRRPRNLLDSVLSITVIVAALLVIYRYSITPTRPGSEPLKPPSAPLVIEDAKIRGAQSAEFVMLEFSDFECPFCRRFTRELLPGLERKYVDAGRLAVAFQHFPLPSHKNALAAAVSAECAGEQGKFWEMHDQLFSNESVDALQQARSMQAVNLDADLFAKCAAADGARTRVERAVAQGKALGVRSTPSFFLGIRRSDGSVLVTDTLVGALSQQEFVSAIDSLINGKRWTDWIPF